MGLMEASARRGKRRIDSFGLARYGGGPTSNNLGEIMAKPCAYCGEHGKLTREHIWPDWILQRTEYHMAYSAKANKVVGRDQTIRDVCAACNNGPLSDLDAYALTLWDPYLSRWVAANEEVDFQYDHSKLLRWLLKLAFNASRTTGTHAELLARYASVLIARDPVTPLFAFAKVATIRPSLLLDQASGKFRIVQPTGARMGPLLMPGLPPDASVITRVIQLNAYWFSLLVVDNPDVALEPIFQRFGALPGNILHPSGRTLIPKPKHDTLWAMRGIEQWASAKG